MRPGSLAGVASQIRRKIKISVSNIPLAPRSSEGEARVTVHHSRHRNGFAPLSSESGARK